ncbi:AgmX/PglI C-terminal domain-containing protein, partial [Corallococcus exiguus]|uniref:AgmX/PglI C-terminal domain-containing protein n=1 Tax=Corallococcus exiguus TaxID=83462 RepID=UPI00149499F0
SKPALPPELKASTWRTVDRVFFGILLTMLVLYVLSVALIIAQPAPVEAEVELDQLEDRFVRAIIPPQPAKKEEPKETVATGEKKPEEEKTAPKKTPTPASPSAPANSAERRQQVEARVAGTGLLKLLGGKGPGGGDAIADVLGNSGSGANVADALAGATAGGALTAGSGGGNGIANPQGDTGGKMAGIGATQTSGAGTVNTGQKQVVKVPQVVDSVPEVDSSEVKPKDLARFIQSRKASIQRCYENGLKRDPSLKGRVMVRFDLTPQGRASNVEVEESTLRSDEVINCIKTTMRAWTFPFKPSDDVPVSYPFIFSPGE